VQEEVNMFRFVVAGAFVFVAAVMASAQTAPQKPGPLDNLVPTPNPAIGPDQVDAEHQPQWRRAMREKYEGKSPGPTPRTPEGKPDLSGVWIAQGTPERPAMTRLGLTVLEDRYKTNMKDYPYSFCLPMAPVPLDGLWVVTHNRAHLGARPSNRHDSHARSCCAPTRSPFAAMAASGAKSALAGEERISVPLTCRGDTA
jgi:hypothetical protein